MMRQGEQLSMSVQRRRRRSHQQSVCSQSEHNDATIDIKQLGEQIKEQLPPPPKIHYDEIYNYIGQLGFYQKCVAALILGFTLFALDAVTMIFVAADMPHFCSVPHLSNLTYDQQKYIAIPYVNINSKQADPDSPVQMTSEPEIEYESCKMFSLNFSQYSEDELENWNRSLMVDGSTPVVECSSWIFQQDTFVSTIISRFELVCGREFFNQLASMLYMIGAILGGVGAGALSDRIGRMPSLIIFTSIKMVGVLASSLSPVYEGFAAGRFFLGLGSSASFIIAYVLMMEIVGPEYRAKAGCAMQIGTSVGFMVQPLVAWCVRHDITYQLASMLPNAIVFLYIIIVPESPRWLLVTGRLDRAHEIFKDMCEVNRTTLPENFDVQNIEKDEEEQSSYFVLLKSPIMRTRTIAMNIIWFFCNLTYFALALNVGYLPGDIYVNTIISSSLEVPAIVLCALLLDWPRLGRRWSAVLAFSLTTLCIALCIPMELMDIGLGVTILNIIGKALNVIGYSIMFVFASEIFPTEVRNSAMGVAQMFACIGSVISPYVGEPVAKVWRPLPYVILGSCSGLSVLLCLLLPETCGKPLCDTVQQAERMARADRLCSTKTSCSSSSADIIDSSTASYPPTTPALCEEGEKPTQNNSTNSSSFDYVNKNCGYVAETSDDLKRNFDDVTYITHDVINTPGIVTKSLNDVIVENRNGVTGVIRVSADEVGVVVLPTEEKKCRNGETKVNGQLNEAFETEVTDINMQMGQSDLDSHTSANEQTRF